MTAVLKINEELNGIELYFQGKPSEAIRNIMKNNGFRWSSFKKCWYTKQSETAFKVANSLTNDTVSLEEINTINTPTTKATNKKQPKKTVTLSLWEATQWNDIKVNNNQQTKEIAKEIRQHIKKRFPQCKFSVTSDYSKISLYIVSSPYAEDSQYLQAIKTYCNNLVNTYKVCYDSGDPYTDIPASYNFYFFNTSIHWEYTQTEQTEDIKKDMLVFDSKLAEFEQAEEEKKEQEYQAYLKEQATRDAEYQKRREEEKKQTQNILNSVNVKSLEENEQYFIIGSEFADLNKNNTLDEYKEEVEKGKYSLENVKVTKEIHFNNQEALENFSNMLLKDFDFLANTGGSFTDDNRINTMTDYNNMDSDERKTVQWNLYGVAIYFNNELQFVVDAQGYNYARYVGLTDNAAIQKEITTNQVISSEELTELKNQADELESISAEIINELNIINTWDNDNWSDYKEAFKQQLKDYDIKLNKRIIQQVEIEKLKVSLYRLLVEVDGIQEQFKKADIEKGEKLTLFYISDWGSIVESKIIFDSATPSTYAQYNNAIKLTFKPEKKRNLHYKYFHSTLLVYKGWQTLPKTVLNEVEENNGFIVTRTKYGSCDNKQYDEIINYFEQQNITPIINTYKPKL